MTGTAESNSRAHRNGEIGEDEAMKLLIERSKQHAVKRVNGLLDFVIGHTWVEVKTCQAKIIDHSRKSGYRNGRFILDIEQHEALKRQDGLYMFIVLQDGELFKHRLMRARDLEYKNNLTWGRLIRDE